MTSLERRRLGDSDLHVTELSLGSWRTYERIPRDAGLAVMRRARDVGINFLDEARYDDETGTAPLKTGYSEAVFGELFRAAGWKRDDVILANKVWWEFWPEQNAAEELDASPQRMKMDYVDLAYSAPPPKSLSVDQVVHEVTDLIKTGKLRAWGVVNWPASLIASAARAARAQGVPGPCAAQLAYSLVKRSPVEDPDMGDALAATHASVVASYTLFGGALTGKYTNPNANGRVTARLDERDYSAALAAGAKLSDLARRYNTTAAAMAIAFALQNSRVATVLFGATKPQQIDENLNAVELNRALDPRTYAQLKLIGV